MALHAVLGDADDTTVLAASNSGSLAREVDRLGGAAGGVVLRIEVEHELAAPEVGGAGGAAAVARQGEGGDGLAGFDASSGGSGLDFARPDMRRPVPAGKGQPSGCGPSRPRPIPPAGGDDAPRRLRLPPAGGADRAAAGAAAPGVAAAGRRPGRDHRFNRRATRRLAGAGRPPGLQRHPGDPRAARRHPPPRLRRRGADRGDADRRSPPTAPGGRWPGPASGSRSATASPSAPAHRRGPRQGRRRGAPRLRPRRDRRSRRRSRRSARCRCRPTSPPAAPPDAADRDDYQTVFAARPGAVAAPTAALHFDAALLADLAARGIASTRLTLHVGAGTFLPVKVEDIARTACTPNGARSAPRPPTPSARDDRRRPPRHPGRHHRAAPARDRGDRPAPHRPLARRDRHLHPARATRSASPTG